MAGTNFSASQIKPIPVLRMGSDLQAEECSHDVNQILSQHVNHAKASLVDCKHLGTELYNASKEPVLHAWRSIGEE